MRFIHELTANDTSKTAKITKKVILLRSTLTLIKSDVLVGNHLFVIFAVLDVSFAVISCINRVFYIYVCRNGKT